MDDPRFLGGQFLLAMPGIGDPRFEKAVIAMCVHDEEGALGIGLGRVIPRLGFHDLLKQLEIDPGAAPNVAIHHGGPVEPQRGFILHTSDWGGNESIQVADRWVLSATLDILKAIAAGKGPSHWVVALGYAGWGPSQLDEELARHGWFATPGDDHLLYECDVESRWSAAFLSAGIDPRLLAAESGTA
ncbi:YqgE/AlgH family protein [Sphingosinicella sp. LHD-64]|uniref:YqgE/AlgH family protein n=1 Tax=Sphingosinicella sp. LHD-64 TaxID=3072139 RepID=UPI00280F5F97|nr:YqgE/AlgH family protein [Sphingosinicella sp. LHD-64]MDQ8755116.1 YqgE/AlgH family protein [Sphingosinicella sp. LHD-64]